MSRKKQEELGFDGHGGLGQKSECAEVRLKSVIEPVCDLCERETFAQYRNTVTELWVIEFVS